MRSCTPLKKLLWVFCSLFCAPSVNAQDFSSPHHPERVLVRFSSQFLARQTVSGSRLPTTMAFAARNALKFVHQFSPAENNSEIGDRLQRTAVFQLAPDANLRASLAALLQDPAVEFAEPDYLGQGGGHACELPSLTTASMGTPDDASYDRQWGIKNTGQIISGHRAKPGVDINVEPAWQETTGDSSILLAVLDSGMNERNFDLMGRMHPGYDFVNQDDDPDDDHGHGSNVGGIAAATGNNGLQIAGVDWQCRIMSLKVLDGNNRGWYSHWAMALQMAADSGAAVINMSMGGTGASRILSDAVDYAAERGSIIVVSMMNNNEERPWYPAVYENVIAVGAVDVIGQRVVPFCYSVTSGSNYGGHIDFVAPGEQIISLPHLNPVGISWFCGTSQATPMVAGLITLMLAKAPNLQFAQIYDLLRAGARDLVGPKIEDSSGWDKYFGWGMIDAEATLKALQVTSVEEMATRTAQTQLAVYPNPSRGIVHIRLPAATTTSQQLLVHDVTGRLVFSWSGAEIASTGSEIVWRPQLAAGMYFVTLTDASQRVRQTAKCLFLP